MNPTNSRDKRFACKCCGKNWIDPRWEALLKKIEARSDERLDVTSGFRCEKHNREVGGSRTSSHLTGLAVDIGCGRSRLRYRIITAAIELGINRIGLGKFFVHLDIDRSKDPRVVWVY